MRWIAVLFLITVRTGAAPAPAGHYPVMAEYLNSFATFGEMAAEFERIGVFSPAEKKSILELLKKNKVLPDAAQPRFKNVKDGLEFGTHKWTFNPKDKYRSHTGISVKPSGAVDSIFEAAFKSFHEPKVSYFSFFINEAHAAPRIDSRGYYMDSRYAELSAAGAFSMVIDHAMRTIAGDILAPTAATFFSGLAGMWERSVLKLRSFYRKGSIRCSYNGAYKLHLGDYVLPRTAPKERRPEDLASCRRRIAREEYGAGHFVELCAYTDATAEYAGAVFFGSENKEEAVRPEKVQSILGASRFNSYCNEERAKIVEAALKKEISTLKGAPDASGPAPAVGKPATER